MAKTKSLKDSIVENCINHPFAECWIANSAGK